jgi:hypothetical protein
MEPTTVNPLLEEKENHQNLQIWNANSIDELRAQIKRKRQQTRYRKFTTSLIVV